MKRLFTILLAVLSLLSLTACGGSPTEETSQEPLVDIQPQEPEAPRNPHRRNWPPRRWRTCLPP